MSVEETPQGMGRIKSWYSSLFVTLFQSLSTATHTSTFISLISLSFQSQYLCGSLRGFWWAQQEPGDLELGALSRADRPWWSFEEGGTEKQKAPKVHPQGQTGFKTGGFAWVSGAGWGYLLFKCHTFRDALRGLIRVLVLYFIVEVGTADIIVSNATLLARFSPASTQTQGPRKNWRESRPFLLLLLWSQSPKFSNALMVQCFSQPRSR